MHDVLLLNADFAPVQILDWRRAVCLILEDKVRSVATYTDRIIRSPGLTLEWPAVVHLVQYARVRAAPRLNRANLLARDGWTCQYCGAVPRTPTGQPDLAALTLDHVVPRAQAVSGVVLPAGATRRVPVSSWENLVAACRPCNADKGARRPAEAGMPLRRPPRRPGPADAARLALARVQVPAEWVDFLPQTWALSGARAA